MFSYNGKILEVELGDSPHLSDAALEPEDALRYLGGVGLAEVLLARRMNWAVDALTPQNVLAFMVGPLTGTTAPGSTRYVVCGKSPLGHWGEAHAAGYWAPELKASGFDGIMIGGSSPRPVYLWVHDGEAEIRDASHLWGMDTYETEAAIKEELGDEKARVVSIGPAGEGLSYLASIIGDEGRAAARTGLGAVMGSKNLKAIAVRGKIKAPLADEKRVKEEIKALLKKVNENATAGFLKENGTPGTFGICAYFGDIPIQNWRLGDWPEGLPGLNAEAYKEILVDNWNCPGCPVSCGRKIAMPSGPYALTRATGPEYECLASLGAMCLVDDIKAVAKASDLCNRLGIDAISAGTAVAFAMECFERGLIKPDQTDGLDLSWGNRDAVVALVDMIGRRKGWLGSLLADGTRKAAEQLGGDAEHYAIHCKGLEFPMHDPKAFSGWTLAYGTTNRGACHLSATTYNVERGMTFPDIGLSEPLDRFASEGKAEMVKIYHSFTAALESLVVCKFMGYVGLTLSDFVGVLEAATGVNRSVEDLIVCGQRVYHLGRIINVACGLRGEDDRLPERILSEPYVEGNAKDFVPDYGTMLKEYYEVQNWSEKGIPRPERLRELGLEEFEGYVV